MDELTRQQRLELAVRVDVAWERRDTEAFGAAIMALYDAVDDETANRVGVAAPTRPGPPTPREWAKAGLVWLAILEWVGCDKATYDHALAEALARGD